MRRTPLVFAGALAVAGALSLTACGDDDDTTTTTEPSTEPTGDGASESALTVGALDTLHFDAESYEATAGTVSFVYENEGSVDHTLLIKDVDGFKLSVGARGTDEGDVDLEAGTYQLYCDVAGHEAAGMVAELTVS